MLKKSAKCYGIFACFNNYHSRPNLQITGVNPEYFVTGCVQYSLANIPDVYYDTIQSCLSGQENNKIVRRSRVELKLCFGFTLCRYWSLLCFTSSFIMVECQRKITPCVEVWSVFLLFGFLSYSRLWKELPYLLVFKRQMYSKSRKEEEKVWQWR